MVEKVILVDRKDRPVGEEEKLKAHQEKKFHRCFSIFIFNSKGEWLLQKRALTKYHSGGLWSNTCCGHPQPGETNLWAAKKRLKEEMGFVCPIREVFTFTYKVNLGSGLWENEFDHVFMGYFNGRPKPNPEEVSDWRWVGQEDLVSDLKRNCQNYAYWFRIGANRLMAFLATQQVKPGRYQHFKGGRYQVLGVARHSETLEELVVYRAEYESAEFSRKAFWVRPRKNFLEKVKFEGKLVPRFKYLEK